MASGKGGIRGGAAFRSVQGCGSGGVGRLVVGIEERERPHTVIKSVGLTFEFRCFRDKNFITHDLDAKR